MSEAAERALAVRRGAGLFRLERRAVLAVEGSDRTRWLDGMLSNDVAALAAGGRRGCRALLLNPKGGIVSELHAARRGDAYWLDVPGEALSEIAARLDRYIVADDVVLRDLTGDVVRLGLEGARAPDVLGEVGVEASALAPDDAADLEIAGVPVLAAGFGWSGESAFQLAVAAEGVESVAAALLSAGAEEAGDEVLEVLRIEVGSPRLGRELVGGRASPRGLPRPRARALRERHQGLLHRTGDRGAAAQPRPREPSPDRDRVSRR